MYDYNVVSLVSAVQINIQTIYICLCIVLILISCDYCADVYNPLMHNSDRDKPQPIHLHREIHGGFVPSPGPYEDDLGADNGLLLL